MIDRRTLKFFKELPKLEESNNDFFYEDFDIPIDYVQQLYQIAKSINIPPRVTPAYTWYHDAYTQGLNSIDLYNTGDPVHEHRNKLFRDGQVNAPSHNFAYKYTSSFNSNALQIPWKSEYKLFEDLATLVNRRWHWVQLIKTDPLGYWGVHRNYHHMDLDQYRLTWIPLNYVKNRFVGGEGVGYFEPRLGKSYILRGDIYNYGGINLGNEPMYNISAVMLR